MSLENERGIKGVFKQDLSTLKSEQRHIAALQYQLKEAHRQIAILTDDKLRLEKQLEAQAARLSQELSKWGCKRIVPKYQPNASRK